MLWWWHCSTHHPKQNKTKTKTCGRYFVPLWFFPLKNNWGQLHAVITASQVPVFTTDWNSVKCFRLFVPQLFVFTEYRWLCQNLASHCFGGWKQSQRTAVDLRSPLTRAARSRSRSVVVVSRVDAGLGNNRMRDAAQRSVPTRCPRREHIPWRRVSVWGEEPLQKQSVLYMAAATGMFLCVYCRCGCSPPTGVFCRRVVFRCTAPLPAVASLLSRSAH